MADADVDIEVKERQDFHAEGCHCDGGCFRDDNNAPESYADIRGK